MSPGTTSIQSFKPNLRHSYEYVGRNPSNTRCEPCFSDSTMSTEIRSVSEAEPYLRAILERGGSAGITVGAESRMLWYDPRHHGASAKLPWPLSRLQLQGCQLRVSEAKRTEYGTMPGKLLRSHDFTSHAEHKTAIAKFLEGTKPDDKILFIQDTIE